MPKRSRMVLLLLAALFFSACEFPSLATPTSDVNLAETQTEESISTLTASPSRQATDTPAPPMLSVSVNTPCRSGPGYPYEHIGTLMTYEEAEILARAPFQGFWVIENPDKPGTECWVSDFDASIQGDTSGLPIRTPPPTATPENYDPTLGSISGFAFYDGNNNGQYGDPQDRPHHEMPINLQQGDCLYGTPIIQIETLYDGSYTFTDLAPDYYCIWVGSSFYPQDPYEINLEPGQNVEGINFWYTP